MKPFLADNFGVREYHPMIAEFKPSDTPDELIKRLKESLSKNGDKLFKKEKGQRGANEFEDQRPMDNLESRTMEELCNAVRDQMVLDIVNAERVAQNVGEDEDSKMMNNNVEEPDEIAREEQSEATIEDNDNNRHQVAKKIFNVLRMKPSDSYINKSKDILDSMVAMTMKKREKGSIQPAQKFNTLRGRWFGKAKKCMSSNECEDIKIERRSIIRTSTHINGPNYLVFVVWKKLGSKYFPTSQDELPTWPVKNNENKTFRLGVRLVNVCSIDEIYRVELIEDIEDGKNV